MLEAIGVVTRFEKTKVTVEITIESGCHSCSSQECGNTSIAKAFISKTQTLTLDCDQPYYIGEQLRLGIAESALLKSAAIIYLTPMLFFLIGGAILQMIWQQESLTIVGAIVSGLVGWLIAKHFNQSFDLEPKIISSLGKPLA